MPLFSDAISPSPVEEIQEEEENSFALDFNHYDALSDVVLLDDEGFPSQLAGDDNAPNETQEGPENSPRKSDFAAEFYRCGTDWSSLFSPEGCSSSGDIKKLDLFRDPIHSGKKLKQANLLQIWGFQKNCTDESVRDCDEDEGGAISGKKNVQRQSWGSISRNVVTDSVKSKSSRKRKNFHNIDRPSPACPFYKKIPGEFYFQYRSACFGRYSRHYTC